MAFEPYKYGKLAKGQIRLLKLVRDSHDAIICSLKPVILREGLGYTCLSYTWGRAIKSDNDTDYKASPTHLIICNERLLMVTENLWLALQELRSLADGTWLWIDAICIDQHNLQERSEQVGIMGRIYLSATQTIIWLGPADENTEETFRSLTCLSNAAKTSKVSNVNVEVLDPEVIESFRHQPGVLGNRRDQLIRFFERSWFTRLWIFQEAFLSKDLKVLCGQYSMLWSTLVDACSMVDKDSLQVLFHASTGSGSGHTRGALTPRLINEMIGEEEKGELINMMTIELFRTLECSEPRDRVFGLRALMPDEFQHAVIPDYKQSVAKIYTQAMVVLMKLHYLVPLSYVEDVSFRITQNLPSWVIDFGAVTLPNSLHVKGQLSYVNDSVEPFVIIDDSTLSMNAYKWNTISSIAPPVQIRASEGRVDEDPILVQRLQIASSFFESLNPQYVTGQGILEAFARTIIANSLAEYNPPTELLLYSLYLLIDQEVQSGKISTANTLYRALKASNIPAKYNVIDLSSNLSLAQLKSELVLKIKRTFNVFQSTRRLFTMTDSYIGLAPNSAKPGDSLWLCRGYRFPLILRRQRNGHYRFIGMAYVEGNYHAFAVDANLAWERVMID